MINENLLNTLAQTYGRQLLKARQTKNKQEGFAQARLKKGAELWGQMIQDLSKAAATFSRTAPEAGGSPAMSVAQQSPNEFAIFLAWVGEPKLLHVFFSKEEGKFTWHSQGDSDFAILEANSDDPTLCDSNGGSLSLAEVETLLIRALIGTTNEATE